MRRTPFLFAAVVAAVLTIAAKPAQKPPQIPKQLGYCVAVYDDTGLVGVTAVLHRADPEHLEEFRGSLRNAISLVGVQANRPGFIEAAARIQLIDNPIPPLGGASRGGGGPRGRPIPLTKAPAGTTPGACFWSCVCGTPVMCSYTEPGTEAVRRNPSPPGGGVCGCGGPCGNPGCQKCTLVCPK